MPPLSIASWIALIVFDNAFDHRQNEIRIGISVKDVEHWCSFLELNVEISIAPVGEAPVADILSLLRFTSFHEVEGGLQDGGAFQYGQFRS